MSKAKNPFFCLNHYFDLSKFPQIALFESLNLVFDPLVQLTSVFDKLRLGFVESSTNPHVVLKNASTIYIGKHVEIDPFVLIEGPVWIDDYVKIKQGAYIRPYSLIGKGAIVGHASEVKHSILAEEAKLPHFNYVGDSLIGAHVNLGAGVKCANVRLDYNFVKLKAGDARLQTPLKKLGCFVGDHASIGCNTVLSPGTLINSYTKIPPCIHVSGSL